MNSFLELSLTRKSHEHDLIDKQLFRTAQKTDKSVRQPTEFRHRVKINLHRLVPGSDHGLCSHVRLVARAQHQTSHHMRQ